MRLVLPSLKYKDSYLSALREFRQEGRYEGEFLERAEADLPALVEFLNQQAEGRSLAEGQVPQTTFWLVDGGEYVGEARVRHNLGTETLKTVGGHIGYAIRSSRRQMGYGKKILELALLEARKLGIKRLLLTCDASNAASRKIIEGNGGIFENEVPGDNGPKRRYWIGSEE